MTRPLADECPRSAVFIKKADKILALEPRSLEAPFPLSCLDVHQYCRWLRRAECPSYGQRLSKTGINDSETVDVGRGIRLGLLKAGTLFHAIDCILRRPKQTPKV